jgi:hypothetical protein
MKFPMQVVFFAVRNTHLVLNVAELQDLFLKFLFREYELFRLGIQFILHLVEVRVELGNRHFEVINRLIFHHKISLVLLDIVC